MEQWPKVEPTTEAWNPESCIVLFLLPQALPVTTEVLALRAVLTTGLERAKPRGSRLWGVVAHRPGLLDVRNQSEGGGQLCPCVNPEGTEMGRIGQATGRLPGLRPVGPASCRHLCAVCRVDVRFFLLV